jgi:hypothetical protein
MARVLRRLLIAIGSMTAAWLAISLIGGIITGGPVSGPVPGIVALVFGGLIYAEIIRRDGKPSPFIDPDR